MHAFICCCRIHVNEVLPPVTDARLAVARLAAMARANTMRRPAARPRKTSQKEHRAKRDRFQRRVGTLPGHHGWVIGQASTAEDALSLSQRLSAQEESGLSAISVKVLGKGETPDSCVVEVRSSKPGVHLEDIRSDILYQRLCELEALKAEVLEEMKPIWDILTSRNVFVQLPDSESEGSEGSV